MTPGQNLAINSVSTVSYIITGTLSGGAHVSTGTIKTGTNSGFNIVYHSNNTAVIEVEIVNPGADQVVSIYLQDPPIVGEFHAPVLLFSGTIPTGGSMNSTNGWTIYLSSGLPVGSGASLADGDYGDVIVSGGGTVLTVDPEYTDNMLAFSIAVS